MRLLEAAEASGVAVLITDAARVRSSSTACAAISASALAETTERHGVCMDVLGLGVLITGDSGVGKSELALELDQPRPRPGGRRRRRDLAHRRLDARVPLPAAAEGLPRSARPGRAQHPHHIRRDRGAPEDEPAAGRRSSIARERAESERLPLHELSEDILGVTVRKVVIPVAAGRNLAVLLEAAVRNYILQLRGIHSTAEFMETAAGGDQEERLKRDVFPGRGRLLRWHRRSAKVSKCSSC